MPSGRAVPSGRGSLSPRFSTTSADSRFSSRGGLGPRSERESVSPRGLLLGRSSRPLRSGLAPRSGLGARSTSGSLVAGGKSSSKSDSTIGSPNAASARTSACRPRRGCCRCDRRSGSFELEFSSREDCGRRGADSAAEKVASSPVDRSSVAGALSRPLDRTWSREPKLLRGGPVSSIDSTRDSRFTGSSASGCPHMLGLDFRPPDAAGLASWISCRASDIAGDSGLSAGCSGVATPKKVATASQELRSREGSGLDFTGSTAAAGAGSPWSDASIGNADLVDLGGPSVFFAVGLREGVFRRFAILFQWSDISKSFRRAAAHSR